jgi:hypothetical protein
MDAYPIMVVVVVLIIVVVVVHGDFATGNQISLFWGE